MDVRRHQEEAEPENCEPPELHSQSASGSAAVDEPYFNLVQSHAFALPDVRIQNSTE